VRQAAFEILPVSATPQGEAELDFGERPRSLLEDFAAFHAEMKGAAPDEETARLFASLVKEAESAPL